jgi:hypothetical protein
MRRIRILGAILGASALTACGAGSQADGPDADPQLDAAPCSQVLEIYDEHERVVTRTFGGGAEGREALQAVVEVVEARPDCFRVDTVESARGMRELLPASDAERAAIEVAESQCADGVGGFLATSKDSPDAATPEDALAAEPELPGHGRSAGDPRPGSDRVGQGARSSRVWRS